MDKAKSIQLFLSSARPESMVLRAVEQSIGIAVESLDIPVFDGVGFVQFTRYAEGFEQGVLVSWPSNVSLAFNEVDLTNRLATYLKTEVLLESIANPGRWLLAKENSCAINTGVTYLDDGIKPELDR